jgi:hypothetical protein
MLSFEVSKPELFQIPEAMERQDFNDGSSYFAISVAEAKLSWFIEFYDQEKKKIASNLQALQKVLGPQAQDISESGGLPYDKTYFLCQRMSGFFSICGCAGRELIAHLPYDVETSTALRPYEVLAPYHERTYHVSVVESKSIAEAKKGIRVLLPKHHKVRKGLRQIEGKNVIEVKTANFALPVDSNTTFVSERQVHGFKRLLIGKNFAYRDEESHTIYAAMEAFVATISRSQQDAAAKRFAEAVTSDLEILDTVIRASRAHFVTDWTELNDQ